MWSAPSPYYELWRSGRKLNEQSGGKGVRQLGKMSWGGETANELTADGEACGPRRVEMVHNEVGIARGFWSLLCEELHNVLVSSAASAIMMLRPASWGHWGSVEALFPHASCVVMRRWWVILCERYGKQNDVIAVFGEHCSTLPAT